MTARPHRLHVISRSPSIPAVGPSSGDLALLLGILVFSLLPVGGVLLGVGFSPAEAGAGAAVAILCVREALATVRARRRARRLTRPGTGV